MCAAIRKAVIPAAGLGTRFLPVTRSVPKELLPILDRPMLQYVVEEAAEAGITDVIVVTSPGKEGIAEYFHPRPDLEARLSDDAQLLEKVRSGVDLATVSFVIQEQPLGLGHAVLIGAESGRRRILCHGAAAVAVERVPWELVQNYGVVDSEPSGEGRHRVHGLVEKPPPGTAPSNLSIVGRYLLPARVFDCLERTPPGARGEVQLTDGLALLMEDTAVYACEFEGVRYDGGNPLGLLRASLEYALKREDTRELATDLVRRLAAEL
ncbi:UTP--glucose-1-phosphate uridylyltransferase [Geodia barretti]|uniref:UTP--glucose-1-phosphate uridylyltransferase n=1 Tax=Geodia barretti TaxID=519541 RepID=A0AA35TKH1_GEOBA|nr:UTP--glucose-1-phosphate uridylyltransferase [Geodia barretti]